MLQACSKFPFDMAFIGKMGIYFVSLKKYLVGAQFYNAFTKHKTSYIYVLYRFISIPQIFNQDLGVGHLTERGVY